MLDEVDVVIIGGGFGGLLTGAHLRKAGVEDIRVIENGSDFGGTWYWNRYPGAQCGGPNGDLTGLRDKRVGIIGTGASAIQSVPHLGESAQHLYVFQRTPSSVDVSGNKPTDPAWAKSLQPGWQRERITNFNVLVGGGHQDVDLVNDGWTDIITRLATFLPKDGGGEISPEQAALATELADFEKMESIRARVDATVDNKQTAEAPKPYYRQFCNRPCFHDGYLPPTTDPTSRSSTPTARVSPASPRPEFSSVTTSTKSTA